VANDTLFQDISARLDSFQLGLQADGCTPDRAQSFRDDVHFAFNTAVARMDSFEAEDRAPTLLNTLIEQCRQRLEFHTVREFVTSSGERIARCEQCRYAANYLSEDFSVGTPNRKPHTYNRHLFFTKRHQAAPGKELFVVTHVEESSGPVDVSLTVTPEVSELVKESRQRDDFTIEGKRVQIASIEVLDKECMGTPYGPSAVRANSDHAYTLQQRQKAQDEDLECTYERWERLVNNHRKGLYQVCREWVYSFPRFRSDMGLCPQAQRLIRKGDRGVFDKANCFWGTQHDESAERQTVKRQRASRLAKDLVWSRSQ
jgi:hypothetical protein